MELEEGRKGRVAEQMYDISSKYLKKTFYEPIFMKPTTTYKE